MAIPYGAGDAPRLEGACQEKDPMKKRLTMALAAGALMATVLPGVASADVGDPGVGQPGCDGRVVAWFNQNSGHGPGFYFRDGQVVKDAINNTARASCDQQPV
jgi:hypothetical protein